MNDEQRERRNADLIGFFLLGCAIALGITLTIQILQAFHCVTQGGTADAIDNQVVCQERLR